MKPYTSTLPNGLRVILVDTEAYPTLTALLLVGAGSRYENEDNNGVAHFFEHMAFKGSKKYPNSFTIASTIESLGGVFNAFTSKDHTGYFIKATVNHLDIVLDVLSDMVLHPLLLSEEIEREKGVIVEEINLYEDTPYRKVGELFESLLYKGNPLGFEIAGSKKTVRSFTRDTFVSYIDELYHPKNAVLVVAGGINQKSEYYLDIVNKKFAKWTNGKKATIVTVNEQQIKPSSLIKYKKTEQAHFCLGFRAFSFFDKRKYALSVLGSILGGGMSSRLFIEVRERRGLCYYIYTDHDHYHDVGNFVTQAGVTNNIDKVREAVDVILKQYKKIIQGKIKKDELKKAKEIIKGRLLLSLEDSFNVASFLGDRTLLEGELERPEDILTHIDKVTEEDIVELSNTIFKPESLNFTMIGPFEEKDKIKLEEVLNISKQ